MKELSIEEKARRYDEALKVLHKYDGANIMFSQSLKEEMFPELKESEDEKTKRLLHSISYKMIQHLCDIFTEEEFQCFDALSNAWLEKQDERESVVVIPKFRVGDVIRLKGSTAEYTIESISGECYHGKGWGLHISCDNDYELVEQKPAWSEEDEKQLNDIIELLPDLSNRHNWLKSLKDRVQPQQKQEWSEEDEQLYNDLSDTYFYNDEDYPEETYKRMLKKVLDWMNKRAKSLRPQNTWKPSKEQMNTLLDAIGYVEGCTSNFKGSGSVLENLYNDLKKLREE